MSDYTTREQMWARHPELFEPQRRPAPRPAPTPEPQRKEAPQSQASRMWSVLEVKAIDEGRREFSGRATDISVDRVGDSIDPRGVKMRLPLVLLRGHDHSLPIGEVFEATPTATGIDIRGRIASADTPPSLKNRLDATYSELRAGLLKGLSIGFMHLASEPIKGTRGRSYSSVEITEISLVAVPCNAECTVTLVRSLDEAAMHAAAAEASQHPEVRRIRSLMQAVGTTVRSYVAEEIRKAVDPLRTENAALRERLAALEPLCDLSSLHAEIRNLKGLTWRGVWRDGETYTKNDICQRAGASWICIADKAGKPGESDKEVSGWQHARTADALDARRTRAMQRR